MSAFGYFEARPAFLGELTTLTVTVAGSGSIAGWIFGGTLYGPNGTDSGQTVTAAVLNAGARTVLVTFRLPSTGPGDYKIVLIRTDDSSGLVVCNGIIEATQAQAF